MSDVNAHDLRIIHTIEDVWSEYTGAGEDCRAGIEVELAFFDPNAQDLTPMTRAQNARVLERGNAACRENCIRVEPSADMLEVASIARPVGFMRAVMQSMNEKIGHLTHVAAEEGLKRSPFQENPHATPDILFPQVIDVPRFQAFFNPPRADMMDIARYFFSSKSTQVSVSYRDHDHLFRDIRRLYALAPFLYMLTDNSSGFDEGVRFTGHAGMRHRSSLKSRGGVPDYVFTAKNGHDYVRSHIEHVFQNPMYVFYDQDGVLQKLPSGTWINFEDLKARGLNTGSNYHLAESILWPDVKIAALKNNAGEVYNHRYEARMFGVGKHQHNTAFLITAGLAFFEDFAEKIDALLHDYGFCTRDENTCRTNLQNAYAAVMYHDNCFFDVAYGLGSLHDFARDFAKIMEVHFAGRGFDAEIMRLSQICATGQNDSYVHRQNLKTLEDVKTYMRTYTE